MKIILYMLAVEASVQLLFHAAPLQQLRFWIIRHTPFLYVTPSSVSAGGHVLGCKYCTSFWIGLFFATFYFFFDSIIVDFAIIVMILHRGSNLIHTVLRLFEENITELRIKRRRE